jgi:methionine-rich copper-binding protein CopC
MSIFSRPLALVAALALAAPLSAASAHPRLLRASPAADSRSTEAPRQLVLTFNESLDLALARVTLHHGEMTVRLDSLRLATTDDKTLLATVVESLAPGRYTVRWQVSGDDGHPVRGTFSFDVIATNTAASPPARR